MNDSAPEPVSTSEPMQLSSRSDDRNLLPWIVATVTVLIFIIAAFFLTSRTSTSSTAQPQTVSAYAKELVLSNLHMSQATNFAGSQLTYIDGTVTNRGNRTVTHIAIQALFGNDAGEAPQAEQVPFTLIRSRDPYIDTESVSAAPLQPGASRDFRLVFDDISPLWNQQLPKLTIISVMTK